MDPALGSASPSRLQYLKSLSKEIVGRGKPLRQERVLSVAGERSANVYLVNLYLPNRVGIIGLPVTDAVLTDEDVLIGMDVISLGDFSISNTEGQTCLSFQYPSRLRIDFVDFYKEASSRLGKDSKAQP